MLHQLQTLDTAIPLVPGIVAEAGERPQGQQSEATLGIPIGRGLFPALLAQASYAA
jgi:hypothetical protein